MPSNRFRLSLLPDIWYALRLLARSPLFAVTSVVSLALGLAATTVIFNLADAMVFRSSPGGRVPAAQALMMSYGARQHVRRNTLQHLHQEITITRKAGSFTLEECLAGLVKAGTVDRADAALRAQHADDFEHAMAT